MKKILVTLMVLAMVCGMAFATVEKADKSIKLTTTIDGVDAFAFTQEAVTGKFAPTDKLTSLSEMAVSTGESTIYASFLSNSAAAYTVTLKGTQLASDTTDTKIDYTVKVADSPAVTVNASDSKIAGTIFFKTERSAAVKESKSLKITLDSASFNAAAAGNYTGTMTLTTTAI